MQITKTRHRAEERGIVLWVTVFIILLLGGLSTAFLYEGLGERTAVEHRRTSMLALEIAEMGAVQATVEITSLKDVDGDGTGNVLGQFAGGDYETQAVQDTTFPDRWKILTRGAYRLSTRRLEIGIRRRVHSDWAEGLYARDGVTMSGDVRTDSYDSSLGTYASQVTNSDSGGPYARTNGHVGSNAQIRTSGSAMYIRGNAIPGPLSTVQSSGTPTITGDTLPRRSEVPLPDPDISYFQDALANNVNNTGIQASGGGKPPYDPKTMTLVVAGTREVRLTGGTYFFSDVRFSGGSKLIVDGPSTIYVTGQFDLGGGTLINTSGVPGDLKVYAHPYPLPDGTTPTHSEVIFDGSAGTALAVYAPAVDITVNGTADVYGAIVGRAIKATGDAYFHYDEALGAWNLHSTVYVERLYWKDLTQNLR